MNKPLRKFRRCRFAQAGQWAPICAQT